MFRPFLVAVLLLASPAFAGREDPEWNPPARFDFPYPGELIVRYLPQHRVMAECVKLQLWRVGHARGTYPEMRGCAIPLNGSCIVVIVASTWKKATPAAVLRHEMGHCNGWPPHHPD